MIRAGTRDRLVATGRAVRWTVPLVGFAVAGVVLLWRRTDLADPGSALVVVRVVGLLLVLGVLPLMDDPSIRQVESVPLPLWVREAPRLTTMVVLVLGPVWVLALAADLPAAALLVEAGSILALAVWAALLVRRATDQVEPSTLVSIGVLVLPAALYLMPTRWALYVGPGAAWADAHVRWAVLLAVGVTGVWAALRDPARRPLHTVWRSTQAPPQTRSRGASDAPVISS